MQKEEAALLAELKSLGEERQILKEQSVILAAESLNVDKLEEEMFNEYHTFEMELNNLSEEQCALRQAIQSKSEQLEKLKRTNVFDDAFYIHYDGHFGTINGLRLGTLPAQPVSFR